ncbi:hypothetical protein [Frisingicoccus sp.]|uniref:hypothetical protein n=1 Tax=Frisingicoccus sp. TaxID=1918627 RepID=UPI002E764DB3|nr:hypothetical protein [Frisingicoccus sp.]MEE0751352.1 hypothetical protein [Frisingicoccus sp.]
MRIINILLRIWAYLPIFSLTDDLGFLTANPGSDQHKYYFSLISILFGEKKYQFMSFPIKQPSERISIFRVKQLSEMDSFILSEEKGNELKRNYKNHYDSLTGEECTIEKEALLQHLAAQKSRIDISYNKINAFTTIIVAVIPLAIAFVDRSMIESLNIFGKAIFILLIYANVNLCAWIFQAINVRGYTTSSFRDLKESNDKAKEQNWQIYYDWQQTRRKADMFVSFVIYTKRWIIAVIILTAVFSVGLPFNKQPIFDSGDNQVYTFQMELLEKTYDKSAADWYAVLAKLQTGEYTKVLILYNGADIEHITEELKRFEQQEIVLIFDGTLKKNEIKIILEK